MAIESELYKWKALKSAYYWRRCNHSELIRFFFPDCKSGNTQCGVDLPKLNNNGAGVEIKECHSKKRVQLTLHDKDIDAGYILFFVWKTRTFYLVPTNSQIVDDLILTEHVGYTLSWVKQNAVRYWKITKDITPRKISIFRLQIKNLRNGKNKII